MLLGRYIIGIHKFLGKSEIFRKIIFIESDFNCNILRKYSVLRGFLRTINFLNLIFSKSCRTVFIRYLCSYIYKKKSTCQIYDAKYQNGHVERCLK